MSKAHFTNLKVESSWITHQLEIYLKLASFLPVQFQSFSGSTDQREEEEGKRWREGGNERVGVGVGLFHKLIKHWWVEQKILHTNRTNGTNHI